MVITWIALFSSVWSILSEQRTLLIGLSETVRPFSTFFGLSKPKDYVLHSRSSERWFIEKTSANLGFLTMNAKTYLALPNVFGWRGPTTSEYTMWSPSSWASLSVAGDFVCFACRQALKFLYAQLRLDPSFLQVSQTLTSPFLSPHVPVGNAIIKCHSNDFWRALLWLLLFSCHVGPLHQAYKILCTLRAMQNQLKHYIYVCLSITSWHFQTS